MGPQLCWQRYPSGCATLELHLDPAVCHGIGRFRSDHVDWTLTESVCALLLTVAFLMNSLLESAKRRRKQHRHSLNQNQTVTHTMGMMDSVAILKGVPVILNGKKRTMKLKMHTLTPIPYLSDRRTFIQLHLPQVLDGPHFLTMLTATVTVGAAFSTFQHAQNPSCRSLHGKPFWRKFHEVSLKAVHGFIAPDLQLDDEHSGSTHNSGHGMYVTSRPEAKSSRRTRKRKGSNASGAGPEPSPPRRILQAHAAARKPFENCAPSIQNNRFGVQRELSFRRSPNMSGRIACNGGPRKQLRQEASSASCLEQEHQHQHQHAALLLLGRTSPSEIGTAPPTNNVDCATTTDPSPPETTAGRGTSHAAKSKSSSQRPQNPSVPRIPVEKSSWAQFL